MTAEGFREVDDGLLADYLGGALEGTPQQEEITRLVSTDPAWAEAYALLAPALTAIRADLARWAEPSPEMPQEIVDRLSAALAAERATTDTAATPRTEPSAESPTPLVVPAQGGAGRRPAAATPAGSERPASTGPGRRRRGWARRGVPVAAAALVVVAASLGLGQLSTRTSDDSGTVSTLDQPVVPEGAPAAGTARTTGPALRSGTNYTPETLGGVRGEPGATSRTTADASGGQPRVEAEGGRRPSPDGTDQLIRLTDEAALTTCLAAVAAEHGSAPLVVEVIDYARFEGEHALVIRFTDAAGARWAWVSGAECGVPGSGADSRYSARVG
ncbi:hypothetical protein O7634_09095 [Micromonospora sp. WMMD1120]|uniref:hypothetical protein n=1 Tax=Micromonospora sp. WMMD1120 TaxID=3016106 RepID=UPI0024160687|nr:hypothetical protein [Micromonospora sp. WMMD1120]MDG4806907.1 hypothetical protein [Micromonospora sp. WMMD1120]